MLELRNMCQARGVSSHKYPNTYEKIVSIGPNIYYLNPENPYELLQSPSTTLMCFQLKHQLILTDKRLLGLRTPMVKTVQIRFFQRF